MHYIRTILISFFLVLTPFSALHSNENNELIAQPIEAVASNLDMQNVNNPTQESTISGINKPALSLDPQNFIASLQESTLQDDAQNSEYLDNMLNICLECLTKIDFDLEHMGLVISNNQARIKDKRNIVQEIIELRTKIGRKKQDTSLGADRKKLSELIDFTFALITHVRYLLTTDLVNFKPFIVRSKSNKSSKLYTYKELEEKVKLNRQLVAKLEAESENVGLSWFNIIFRKVERFNSDYKVVRTAAVATGVAVALSWLVYRLDADYFVKAKKFLGFSKKSKKRAPSQFPKAEKLLESSSSTPLFAPSFNGLASNENNTQFNPQELAAASLALGGTQQALLRSALGIADVDYKEVPWWKKFLGSPTDSKVDRINGVSANDPRIGIWTRVENTLEHNLKFISFAPVPIVLYEVLKPTALEWAEKGYDWFSARRAQVASILRGGPVKHPMEAFEKDIKVTFDDVIGNEHAKTVLSKVVDYIVNYDNYDRAGLVPSTGILLVGDSRTGKSFIAEALAGSIKLALMEKGSNEVFKFIPITVADLKNSKFGGISNILLSIRELAPVVVFIDELDTGGFQRERDSKALSELQLAMSKLNEDKSKKVIILAATNKPENLDFTLTKEGRFGEILEFSLPTTNERKEFILRELNKRAVSIEEDYIDKLAHESENCTYDALTRVIITAMQKAKMNGTVLTWKELDEAFNEKIYKIITDEDTLPEAELFTIAAHQAGHAFLRLHLNPSLQLTKVTIRPTIGKINEQSVWSKYKKENQEGSSIVEHGKVFTAHNADSLKYETSQDLIDELMISLAGHIAEKLLLDGTSYSYHMHDNEQALSIAKHIVFGGMPKEEMPKKLKEQKLLEAYDLVKQYEQKVTEILTEHKQALIVITNFLSEHKTLSAAELRWILKKLKKTMQKEAQENLEAESLDEPVIAPAA